MTDILVDIQHLTFKRGDRVIYRDLKMQFSRGKVTAIMGPSGIGKTTLLRLIGGQLKPDEGQILVGGQDVPTLSRSALYQLRKRMSMLFQSGALFSEMSVLDNVAFPISEHTRLPESLIRLIVLMNLLRYSTCALTSTPFSASVPIASTVNCSISNRCAFSTASD